MTYPCAITIKQWPSDGAGRELEEHRKGSNPGDFAGGFFAELVCHVVLLENTERIGEAHGAEEDEGCSGRNQPSSKTAIWAPAKLAPGMGRDFSSPSSAATIAFCRSTSRETSLDLVDVVMFQSGASSSCWFLKMILMGSLPDLVKKHAVRLELEFCGGHILNEKMSESESIIYKVSSNTSIVSCVSLLCRSLFALLMTASVRRRR